MNTLNTKFEFQWLIILFVGLVPWIGMYDFYTRGEPREALTVQSMFESGDLILPRGYNNEVPAKPPLFHWLGALVSKVQGRVDEFSVRLPSVLFSLATITFFTFSLRSQLTGQAQLLFILFLMFSFEWLRASLTARVDMVHAASLACGLLSGFFAINGKGTRWWLITTLLLTLATLGKGPVAIAIPSIIFVAWLILKRPQNLQPKRFIPPLVVLGLSFTFAGAWYVAAYLSAPSEFLSMFWYENIQRFAGTMADKPHEHSLLYLPGVLFVGTLPWAPIIFYFWIKGKIRGSNKVSFVWSTFSQLTQFSILASLVVFFFYCIPSSKRGAYLLAAYPFLALLGSLATVALVNPHRKVVTRILLFAILISAIAQIWLIPRYIAGNKSERPLSNFISKFVSPGDELFSFNFEFYGTSYYLNRTLRRLENRASTPNTEKSPQDPKSFVILFSTDLPEVNTFLKTQGILSQIISSTALDGKEIKLLRLLAEDLDKSQV